MTPAIADTRDRRQAEVALVTLLWSLTGLAYVTGRKTRHRRAWWRP